MTDTYYTLLDTHLQANSDSLVNTISGRLHNQPKMYYYFSTHHSLFSPQRLKKTKALQSHKAHI